MSRVRIVIVVGLWFALPAGQGNSAQVSVSNAALRVPREADTVLPDGSLSVEGLGKISEVEESLPPVEQPLPGQPVISPSQRDPMAFPTHDHFKALQTLVADLKKTDHRQKGSSGQCAIWYDRYATKIDRLPILNVDSDLLDFTANVAVGLRGLAGAYRQAGIQSAQYSANPTSGWVVGYIGGYGLGRGYGGYGFWGPSMGACAVARISGPSPRSTARRLGRANASRIRSENFQVLDAELARTRRQLTEKYGLEF